MSASNGLNIKTSVRGLELSADRSSIGFVISELPASEHFFFATNFMIKPDGGQLYCVFGAISKFAASIKFDRAIEIVLPIELAKVFLVENVWEKEGANGVSTFGASLEKEIKKQPASNAKQNTFEMPDNADNTRMFPSNLALASYASGQAMIEFLEAPPAIIAKLVADGPARPNESVSNLVSVIMDPRTLYDFLCCVRDQITSPEQGSI